MLGPNDPTNYLAITGHRVLRSVKDHLDNCLLPGETRSPVIPVLSTFAIDEYVNRIDSLNSQTTPFEKVHFAVQAFAAFLYEVRDLWSVGPVPDLGQLSPNVTAEFNSYAAWKIGQASKNSESDILGLNFIEKQRLDYLKSEVESLLDGQRHSIGILGKLTEEAGTRFDETIERLRIDSDATQTKVSGMNQTLEASREDLTALLNEVDTAKEHVQAFAKAVREELKVDATKKLWNRRATDSAFSFWASAIVIAGAILYPPYWAFTHIEVVVLFLRRVGDAAVQGLPAEATAAQLTAATISKLVIVSAPLALYFWAIKLIVRFNTRSMVLMDDARQRQTTMDTYFHLVESNKASVEERGLMLNALFKPLPGQGQENVEPPNFIEIINKKPD